MDVISEYSSLLIEGLLNNLLIVAVTFAIVFPIGFLLSFFSSKSKTAEKVFGWLSLPFECIPIMGCLYFVSYSRSIGFDLTVLVVTLISFAICFIGYMPARYDTNSSFLKNILYNGLGLISNVLKWSVVSSIIGTFEFVNAARIVVAHTFKGQEVWSFVFVALFVLILPFEIGRRLIKQLMK